MIKRLGIRKFIILSVICTIIVAVAGFLTWVFIMSSEIGSAVAEFKKFDAASVICVAKQKFYVVDGIEGNTLREQEKTFAYGYNRNGNGYDVKCGAFVIKDNVIYLGGKKAKISDEETVSRYETVFVRHQAFDYVDYSEAEVPVFDPTKIAEALLKHHAAYINKSVNGTVAEYRAYFGNNFYAYVLRNGYADHVGIYIEEPLSRPLTVTLLNGKLKAVNFSVKVRFEMKKAFGGIININREYFYDIEFSDECDVKAETEMQNVREGFYKQFVPREMAKVGGYYSANTFFKGKAYCVDGGDDGTTLKIFDLKSGETEITKKLGTIADLIPTRVSVKDGYVYAFGGTEIAYEYDMVADTVRTLNRCSWVNIAEDGVAVTVDGKYFFGENFDNLTENVKNIDGVNNVYNAETGRYYQTYSDDNKSCLALVARNGQIIKDIEYEFCTFNSVGVVIAIRNGENAEGFAQMQLNQDLELVGNCADVFDANAKFIDSVSEWKFYDYFVKNEETGEYYYIERGFLVYGRFYVYDGDMYFLKNGVIYCSDGFDVVVAEDKLFF